MAASCGALRAIGVTWDVFGYGAAASEAERLGVAALAELGDGALLTTARRFDFALSDMVDQ